MVFNECVIDLACHEAFETADDVLLAQSLGDPSSHVGERGLMPAHADRHDAVERCVRPASTPPYAASRDRDDRVGDRLRSGFFYRRLIEGEIGALYMGICPAARRIRPRGPTPPPRASSKERP